MDREGPELSSLKCRIQGRGLFYPGLRAVLPPSPFTHLESFMVLGTALMARTEDCLMLMFSKSFKENGLFLQLLQFNLLLMFHQLRYTATPAFGFVVQFLVLILLGHSATFDS